ncbi:MAG TPA: glycosyltransferase family 4 protein [Polyangiaceae bacterium]|nr:glycosyltransferase family 4 protein [Polyangiaceae bacterium]
MASNSQVASDSAPESLPPESMEEDESSGIPGIANPMRAVAVVGTFLPRRCGIATFSTDLSLALCTEFPDLDCLAVAMNDGSQNYAYPERVRFELREGDVACYRRAADFLNVNAVDAVSLQHEYGIFGGKCGVHVLALLRELRMPVVTTLHTILPEPSDEQRVVMDQIVQKSARLVVMSLRGAALLQEVHHVPAEKIDVIPHGITPAATGRRSKQRLGVQGRTVLFTFGLLSPDKGIESVIDALPEIVRAIPDVLYVVLGETHPHVKAEHGESYRLALQSRAKRLRVGEQVVFHNRFVLQQELAEFMSAADIYVTPYLKAEQSTSGTLAYAVGSGKVVISTPYAYARELLGDQRGVIVPWRNPAAIAHEVIELCKDDVKRRNMGMRAASYGSNMLWPQVARQYNESFSRARAEHAQRQRSVFELKTIDRQPLDLPDPDLRHVRQMTDSTGMLQHSRFNVPRYQDGYCVDDNARALLLMTLLDDAGAQEAEIVRSLALRYLAFVSHAFNEATGRFRNFMSYDRSWLEPTGSEDSQGRCVWALGCVIGRSNDPGRQSLAGVLFQRALQGTGTFTSPRAWAFVLLGIAEYLRAFRGDSNVEQQRQLLAERLLDLYRRTHGDDWRWFEDSCTYENARLSQAMLSSGALSNDQEMLKAGFDSLHWLLSVHELDEGDFAPVGSNSFYRRGGPKARFDQQPLDAWAMISACLEAHRISGEQYWAEHARRAFGWFLGQNHLQQALYDAATGGCRDGLHADRINQNQGAESTLSFQLALLEMRALDLLPSLSSHGSKT